VCGRVGEASWLNLTIYYTAREDNLSSYFYYGNHSKGAK
jgi:hypothetical protein